jgi:GAF domain-containing protein
MSNLRSVSKKGQLNQALAVLNKIGQTLIATQDLPGVLKKIAKNARDVLQADIVDLYEYNQKNNEFSLPPILIGKRRHRHIPKVKIYNDDVVVKVVKAGKPKYFPDAQAATLLTGKFNVKRDDAPDERFVTREGVLSSVSIPLLAGGEAVGVMFVNYRSKQAFDNEQKSIIESFSNLAAIAIYNSRLYKADQIQTQALTRLSELSQRLVSIREEHQDVRKLLEEIAQSAKEVLVADIIELYEYSQTKRSYELPQISVGERIGPFVPKHEIYNDDAVLQLINRDQPSYIENSQVDDSIASDYTIIRADVPDERFAIREKIHSTAAIPLKVGDESVGLMFANYRIKQEFTNEQKELIELFANQAAIAIQNARLYKQINRKIEDLNVLGKIGQQLTANMRLQEQEILELVHRQAGELMDADNMYIALYDEKEDTIKFGLAFKDGKPISIQTRKIDDARKGRTEEIIRTKQPIFIPAREESIKWYHQPGRVEFTGDTVWPSWIGVPMVVRQKVIGVIATYHPTQDNVYSEDDLIILQAMADQAAIALDNSRTFQALVDFGQKVSAGIGLHEDEILKLIYEQASKLMDMDNMYIALYDDMPADTIRFGLAFQNGKPISVDARKIDDTRRGRTEEIIRTRQSIFIATRDESEKWYQQPGRAEFIGNPMPSWLGVPMMVEDKVLGVVATYHPTDDNVYSKGDEKILQSMANIAAVAINNARLYEMLEATNERIAETEAVVIRTSIAADFVHHLNNLAGTIPIWVDLIRKRMKSSASGNDELVTYVEKYLAKIDLDADHLLREGEQLKSPLKVESIQVDEMLGSLVRQALVQIPAKIKISFDQQPLPPIQAVATELNNALWCVIENGIDAMPDGGPLEISTSVKLDDNRKQWINIQIKDQGKGISKEYRNKVFLPFQSTKPGHMGYGLWRTRNIIERLGGTITFDSVEKVGTTFIINLPDKEGQK